MATLRRVVTGQPKAGGQATISSDGPVPTVFGSEEAGGPILFEIWKTFATPALLTDKREEPATGDFVLEPPANGAVFRMAIIPPDADMAAADHHPVFDQLGEAQGDGHAAQMHRTSSIDFGIVIEGSVWLIADGDETELKAGEVVVQRGANHAWSNRSDKPCRMAFVMIDARYG